jgi:hypothetical protein
MGTRMGVKLLPISREIRDSEKNIPRRLTHNFEEGLTFFARYVIN